MMFECMHRNSKTLSVKKTTQNRVTEQISDYETRFDVRIKTR